MIEKRVMCLDCLEYSGSTYFPLIDHNALGRIDKSKKQIEIIGIAENVKYNMFLPYGMGAVCGKYCFFSPHFSNDFLAYNTSDNTIKTVMLRNPKQDSLISYDNQQVKFCNVLANHDKVFFFGFKYPAIACIDSNDYSIEYKTDWIQKIPHMYQQNVKATDWYFGNGYVRRHRDIYIPSGVGPGLWKIDIDSMDINYIDTHYNARGFWSIANYGKNIILTSSVESDSRLFVWNIENESGLVINIPTACHWNKPITYLDFMYFFPGSPGGEVFRMNMNSYEIERFDRLDGIFSDSNKEEAFALCVKQFGSVVSFIRASDRCWFSYDFATDELSKNYFIINDDMYLEKCEREAYSDFFAEKRMNSEIIYEGDFSVKEFLQCIVDADY